MAHARKQVTPTTTPVPDALSADPGPLLFTIGINRSTSRLTFSGNTASEHDLELLREALTIAQSNVHQQLLAAAAARGRAESTKFTKEHEGG